MIKVSRIQSSSDQVIVRIEGSLVREAVPELTAMCAAAHAGALNRTLDVSGVRRADRAGQAALIDLRRSGWLIEGASLYLHSLLQEAVS